MSIDLSDIRSLRRLPLSMGLIVLTWAVAGVALESPARVDPLGIPLLITRPAFLPIGLVLASLYGAGRYYYYALMLATSPYRIRGDLLNELRSSSDKKAGLALMYWGPVTFSSSPWQANRSVVEDLSKRVTQSWPKFFRARVQCTIQRDSSYSVDEDVHTPIYALSATIPKRCRLAAFIHDADYASPVWFPILVTVLFLIRTVTSTAA